jgi:hypothetical protein
LLSIALFQAVSQEQCLLVPVFGINDEVEISMDSLSILNDSREDIEELLLALPRNLHWDKQRKKSESAKDQTAASSLDILEEEEEKEEEGLENAWQYRKSVQQERLGQPMEQAKLSSSTRTNTSVFCHSYDLSGRMNEQSPIDVDKYIVSLELQSQATTQAAGFAMFRKLAASLKKNEGKVVRLLLFHLDLAILAVALPLLLSHVRQNSIPIVLMVSTVPTPDCKSWIQLARASDVVFSTEGFASRNEYPPPAEFRHLQGLLKISKVSTVTAPTANGGGHFADLTVSKRPAAFIYGFKRDRRKLHIPLLHIPPEDYAEGGGSTSGVRSGAGKPSSSKNANGMGCSSNLSGSVLDF